MGQASARVPRQRRRMLDLVAPLGLAVVRLLGRGSLGRAEQAAVPIAPPSKPIVVPAAPPWVVAAPHDL